MNDKLEQVLYKIDFFERVKKLSERYISDSTEFIYDVNRILEILLELGYSAIYHNRESFFEITDEYGSYRIKFQISVEYGYLDAGWYVYKGNSLIWGDVWQMLSIDFDDRYEEKMKPTFSSYEEMREILRETLMLYEDFKHVVLDMYGN